MEEITNETKDYTNECSLHYACELGDNETVNALLTFGEDPNQIDRDGKTPLHFACSMANEELIKTLLSFKADILLVTNDNKKQSNLHISALNGSAKILQLILEYLQNSFVKEEVEKFIRLRDAQGKTAIHWASENGFMDCVDLLITYGADINEKDEEGRTSLHHCAHFGIDYSLELLLNLGANIDDRDHLGRSALHLACIGGHKYCVDLLIIKGAKIIEQDKEGLTGLHFACLRGDLEISQLLISKSKKQSEIDLTSIKDYLGRNVLHAAASSSSFDLVNYLLTINLGLLKEVDNNGRTVLIWSLINANANSDQSFDTFQTIWNMWEVDHKIYNKETRIEETDLYKADEYGRNALHYSSFYRHYFATNFLLEKGVNPLQKDNIGRTPAHYCAHSKKFLELLKEFSVPFDDFVKDSFGASPLLFAAFFGSFSSLVYLLEEINEKNNENNENKINNNNNNNNNNDNDNNDDNNNDDNNKIKEINVMGVDEKEKNILHYLAMNKNISQKTNEKIIRYLIEEKELKMDQSDKRGFTPVHLASALGNISFLTTLSSIFSSDELKYLFNIEDYKGRQPIHIAALADQSESLAFLIINGSELSSKDENNLTALHIAVLNNNENSILSFIAAAPDLNFIFDHEGKSPLSYAAYFGYADHVDTFLFYGADLRSPDHYQNTPLHYSLFADTPEATRVLVDNGAYPLEKNKEGITPLHIAATRDDVTYLSFLLSANVSPEEINEVEEKGKRSCLHFAVVSKSPKAGEITQLLLDHFADVNLPDENGKTPLHWSSLYGNLLSLPVLLSNEKIKINAEEKSGRTSLHFAVALGHLSVVQSLIESGASIDHADHNGTTPVMLSSFYQHEEILKFLIKAGANINLVDSKNRNLIKYAKVGAKKLGNSSLLPSLLSILS